MMDFTKCSTIECEYRNKCLRALIEKDDLYECWCNFKVMGCDLSSGFDCFIPIINEGTEEK